MYQNKFLHKQAATPLFDTAKKYLTQLGKGVQDKWNSLGEDTRDALKVAAPSALIAGTGSWLLGDEDRSVGRKALDSVLWGSGVGTAAFGGTKLANHLLRANNKQYPAATDVNVADAIVALKTDLDDAVNRGDTEAQKRILAEINKLSKLAEKHNS